MVWTRLALPLALLLVHFAVLLIALASLAVTGMVMRLMGIEEKIIPGYHTTLGDWMLYLEISASSVIIIAGVFEALVLLALGIILDCVTRIRKIGRAWRS